MDALKLRLAIDVVITDIKLPGEMDWLALASWIAKNRPAAQVIVQREAQPSCRRLSRNSGLSFASQTPDGISPATGSIAGTWCRFRRTREPVRQPHPRGLRLPAGLAP